MLSLARSRNSDVISDLQLRKTKRLIPVAAELGTTGRIRGKWSHYTCTVRPSFHILVVYMRLRLIKKAYKVLYEFCPVEL